MTEREKRVIMRTGHMLRHAMVDGMSIVTNGHVILPMEPFFDNEEGDTVKPESVERKWRSIPEILGKSKPVQITGHVKFMDQFCARLSNKATLNTAYLYLFDGCEVFSAGKKETVVFVRNGTITGAVMPMRELRDPTPCDAPTLEDVLAGMAASEEARIAALEEEIRDKRADIKNIEDEIAELQADIAKIRQRQEG